MSTAFYDSLAPHFREYASRRRAYLDAVDGLVVQGLHGRTLLDVGSGDGVRILGIARRAGIAHLTLTEPSEEMRRRCYVADPPPGTRIVDIPAEDLDRLDERFDNITCLWNVLGHVESPAARVRALRSMAARLAPGGTLQFDVNNRYNVRAYGWISVVREWWRDRLHPGRPNGERAVEIVIGGTIVRGHGYLFNRHEVDAMLAEAGLRTIRAVPVDYSTGRVRATPREGQLFYQVERG